MKLKLEITFSKIMYSKSVITVKSIKFQKIHLGLITNLKILESSAKYVKY